jgi:hypothetical protein
VSRPIFIIGCGRSGTTILGTALSKHADITYLNEPRKLWFSCYPETDIWTDRAFSRRGKLAFTDADVEHRKSRKLRRLFRLETVISRRPVLIEKLPINNFRLNFIHQIFPDARFIHIYRNGLEVARSIENLCERGRWFGARSYKWDRLVDYASSGAETGNLPALCTTYFDKGLLEWRLSTESAVAFLSRLPDSDFIEINYDELVDEPVGTVSRIVGFVGVRNDPDVTAFVSDNVARRSRKLDVGTVCEKTRMIGGALLPLSMDGARGLTRRYLPSLASLLSTFANAFEL